MADVKRYDNYIDGQWVGADRYQPNINPSDLSDVIGEYAQAGAAQVVQAVAAARRAFPAWSTSGIQARADSLEKVGLEILARREELGALLAREEGKTLPEAIGEVARAGNIFKVLRRRCLRQAGETLQSVRPRRRRGSHPRAARRGRADHSVELPDRHPRLEDRPGTGLR